ncbi:MAG: hypothetical protein IT437_04775 [Phycisphaerales bacterium]|nr:hypothetical protein [Phycisphaerales bacterium]
MNARTIHAARAVATWGVRAPSAAAVALGAYLLLKKVAFGIGTGQVRVIYDIYEGVGEGHDTYKGLALVVVGVACGLLSRRMARWIVTVPETGCPACGYAVQGSGPCPECGYVTTGDKPVDHSP